MAHVRVTADLSQTNGTHFARNSWQRLWLAGPRKASSRPGSPSEPVLRPACSEDTSVDHPGNSSSGRTLIIEAHTSIIGQLTAHQSEFSSRPPSCSPRSPLDATPPERVRSAAARCARRQRCSAPSSPCRETSGQASCSGRSSDTAGWPELSHIASKISPRTESERTVRQRCKPPHRFARSDPHCQRALRLSRPLLDLLASLLDHAS